MKNLIYKRAVSKCLSDMVGNEEFSQELMLKHYATLISVWNYELNAAHLADELLKLHDKVSRYNDKTLLS